MTLKTCSRCGFFTAEQHECERLRGLKPPPSETFREVPPASPLAALKGAVTRLEAAGRDPYADHQRCPRCNAPNTAALGPAVAICQRCGADMHELTPTPAATLVQVERLVLEAAALAESAGRPVLGESLRLMASGAAAAEEDERARAPGATPSATLAEALELMERARVLALNAYDQMPETSLSRVNGLVRFGEAMRWVEIVKLSAEAKHGR